MASRSKVADVMPIERKHKPPKSEEEHEAYLIALANQRAEERLLNGTATSQEIVHFLKLGSRKERLEREKAEEEVKLLRAKTEALQATKDMAGIYEEAIKAMREYTGNPIEDDEDDDE